ncbi:MAG: hypothetical protein ACREKM_04825, partial [Longimicrobiales bacterium]
MRGLPVALSIALTVTGCIHHFSSLDVRDIEAAPEPTLVSTPVRAHLVDGSTVVYRTGVSVATDTLRGDGMWYGPMIADSQPVMRIAMDSVVGLEAITVDPHVATTTLVSTVATLGAIGVVMVGTVAISCIWDPKCFGSCPTVYTMGADGEVLEAELFSYSVAPLLEARDVDRIGTHAGADGFVQVEIRDEALETHRINYLGVLAVTHEADELIVPDARGEPLALGGLTAAARASDATGRDVRPLIAARDSAFYTSAPALLAAASVDQLEDHIDLTLPAVTGADSIAVVLRLRNSLLNTVLFYDLMLASAGAQALDWMGAELQRIGPAIELGQWYTERMGMQVHVHDGSAFQHVARIPDAGPIAWKDVAVAVPVLTNGDSIRIRLSFVVDEWRIDRIRIATAVRRPEVREIAVTEVIGPDGRSADALRSSMSAPDEAYAETLPGQRFTARFDVGHATSARTFMIAAQGYYTEWIRPDWIRTAQEPRLFVPGDEALVEALVRWRAAKADFERS